MFVVDEQSDFQKPLAVKRKRVCACDHKTSQPALGAVCAEFVNCKRCFGLKITPIDVFALTVRSLCHSIVK